MWQLLEQAAKSATANATEYVSTAQARAQSLVATVQDEATTLLHALGTTHVGPVDEILYEEIEDFKAFSATFAIDDLTEEVSKILEEDDEIRELHEAMVPVQLSYEEFWCRYFFRREQDEARERAEEERLKKKREQDEAREAARAVLHEFELDDDSADDIDLDLHGLGDGYDDDDEEDGSTTTVKVEEGDTEAMTKLKQELASKDREVRVHRRAARQWQQKAVQYQKHLGALSAKHVEEKRALAEGKENEYQELCASYETKMTEATMQIDAARASGYDAGIQESEVIVASVRQEAEQEVERLKMELAQAKTAGGDAPTASVSTADSASSGMVELRKEMELWKARAIKMKKVKETVDAELLALKQQIEKPTGDDVQEGTDPGTSAEAAGGSDQVAALRATVAALEQQRDTLAAQVADAFSRGTMDAEARARDDIEELREQLALADERVARLEEGAFESGVQAGREAMMDQVERLKEELAAARTVHLSPPAEVDTLRSELATLRAEISASKSAARSPLSAPQLLSIGDDILAQADAMLSALGSGVPHTPADVEETVNRVTRTSGLLLDSEDEDELQPHDTDDDVDDLLRVSEPRGDDWGEW